MNTIRLESAFDRTHFIKSNKIFWYISYKKHIKKLIYHTIISIVILSLGLIIKQVNDPDNPLPYLGIGLLILSMFRGWIILSSWELNIKKIKIIAKKFEALESNCIIELNSDSLKYWDYEKHLDFKWSAFSHYSIYKENILLFLNNSMIGGYIIDKNDFKIEYYNQTLELLKLKLEYKEIK